MLGQGKELRGHMSGVIGRIEPAYPFPERNKGN